VNSAVPINASPPAITETELLRMSTPVPFVVQGLAITVTKLPRVRATVL
jgi:hypothetical protein